MPWFLETDDRCQSQAQIKLMRRHYLSSTEQSAASLPSLLRGTWLVGQGRLQNYRNNVWSKSEINSRRKLSPDLCLNHYTRGVTKHVTLAIQNLLNLKQPAVSVSLFINERRWDGYSNKKLPLLCWHQDLVKLLNVWPLALTQKTCNLHFDGELLLSLYWIFGHVSAENKNESRCFCSQLCNI